MQIENNINDSLIKIFRQSLSDIVKTLLDFRISLLFTQLMPLILSNILWPGIKQNVKYLK